MFFTSNRPALFVLAVILLFLPGQPAAEDHGLGFSEKHKDYLDLLFFDPSDIYLQYIYKPEFGGHGQLQQTDLNLLFFEADAGLELGPDTLFFFNLEYTFRRYNFDDPKNGSPPLGSPQLHQFASLMGPACFFTEDLVGLWSFYPGISSDLSRSLKAKDFNWSSGPVAAYRFSPRFGVHGGIQVSVDYYDTEVFPIGGISYFSPDREWHVNITAPFLYRVGKRVSQNVEFYSSVWYSRSTSQAGLGPAHIPSFVEVSDVQAGIGALWSFNRNLTLTFETGMAIGSRFHIKKGLQTEEHKNGETLPYVATALGWRF